LKIDEKRLRIIIKIEASKASMNVTAAGHLFAIRSSASGLTPATSLMELFSGLTQVHGVYKLT
jgi:Zn-dependent M16 (insulinase) family peptidase